VRPPLGSPALHNGHVPNGSNHESAKHRVFEVVYADVSSRSGPTHVTPISKCCSLNCHPARSHAEPNDGRGRPPVKCCRLFRFVNVGQSEPANQRPEPWALTNGIVSRVGFDHDQRGFLVLVRSLEPHPGARFVSERYISVDEAHRWNVAGTGGAHRRVHNSGRSERLR